MYPQGIGRALAVLGMVLAGLIVACWHSRGGTTLDHWAAIRLVSVTGSSLLGWAHRATEPWYVLMAAWGLALRHEFRGSRRRAAALLVPVVAALAVTELVLKPGVDARSVSGGSWTFPSGNVTGGVALVTAVYWVEIRRRRTLWRVTGIVALAILVGLSCISLVADGTHFLTDVVGGICVGIGVPLAILGRRSTPDGARPRPKSFTSSSPEAHR
jgi:membrane-associated phospholipid phosphatase